MNRLESLGELHALAGRVGSSLIALEKSHQQIISQLDRTEGNQIDQPQSFFYATTIFLLVLTVIASISLLCRNLDRIFTAQFLGTFTLNFSHSKWASRGDESKYSSGLGKCKETKRTCWKTELKILCQYHFFLGCFFRLKTAVYHNNDVIISKSNFLWNFNRKWFQ